MCIWTWWLVSFPSQLEGALETNRYRSGCLVSVLRLQSLYVVSITNDLARTYPSAIQPQHC